MKYGLLTKSVPPFNLAPRAFPLKVGGARRPAHLHGKSPGNEVDVLLHVDRPRQDTAAIFLW